VRQAKWKLSYSDAKEVGLQVALFPRRHADVRAAVFDLTLVRRAAGGQGRWLVSAFSPSPVTGALDDEELTPLGTPRLSPVSTGRGPLGAAWLAIPLGVVGLALLGLAGFGAAAWYRGRRARRIAAAARQTSSSSPS
jgi:hypothetical protein